MVRESPKAPQIGNLPKPRQRAVVGGPVLAEFSVRLKTVTPILGGSARTRTVDEVDIIRAGSIRGHLRFWWRALNGAGKTAAQLYEAEGGLWGRAAGKSGGRAPVEVWVDEVKTAGIDGRDIEMGPVSAYALWPARKETRPGAKPAPRYSPGLKFTLHVRCLPQSEGEVRNAVRAWILFGGYGGRTRRGLGALGVDGTDRERAVWLPQIDDDAAEDLDITLTRLFGRNRLAGTGATAGDLPVLAGAALIVDRGPLSGGDAWNTALGWLRCFRQGAEGPVGQRAREPGSGPNAKTRPGRSNWPEADKVRHLAPPHPRLPWAHPTRHNDVPVWPRAGFGLPIIGQFQMQSRESRPGSRNLTWEELPTPSTEPGRFQLRWRRGGTLQDRLASPLIVKPLGLANGRFLPCALWLHRGYPAGGEVVLELETAPGRFVEASGSAAGFDRLHAPLQPEQAKEVHFNPLRTDGPLRPVFLAWLLERDRDSMVQVAP